MLQKLYAQLQLKPANIVVYRKIAEIYRESGLINEAEAFEKLVEHKLNDHSHSDTEQL